MADCSANDVAEGLTLPVLVVRPVGEAELGSVAAQLERFATAGQETFVADPGVHGSSTLNPERVGADVSEALARVDAFLERILAEGS